MLHQEHKSSNCQPNGIRKQIKLTYTAWHAGICAASMSILLIFNYLESNQQPLDCKRDTQTIAPHQGSDTRVHTQKIGWTHLKKPANKIHLTKIKLVFCATNNEVFNVKLEVCGRARREAARRRNSEWKVNFGI